MSGRVAPVLRVLVSLVRRASELDAVMCYIRNETTSFEMRG